MADRSTAPILIIGPPRSGTTLLANMLNAHPRIFLANEAKAFVKFLPEPGQDQGPLTEATASAMVDGLENHEMFQLAPLPRASEALANLEQPTVTTFLAELFRLLAEREGKPRWGEKTAVAFRRLPALQAAYPGARLIALDRPPEEIAASYIRQVPKWGALGGVMHWLDFRRTLAEHPDADILVVPYHELVQHPEMTLAAVCDHVGESYDAAMLHYHETERARMLSAVPRFSESGAPLFTPKPPPPALQRGLSGRILRACVERGNEPSAPKRLYRPMWERAVRGALAVRAAVWQLTSADARASALYELGVKAKVTLRRVTSHGGRDRRSGTPS